jgi:hypothetical protein
MSTRLIPEKYSPPRLMGAVVVSPVDQAVKPKICQKCGQPKRALELWCRIGRTVVIALVLAMGFVSGLVLVVAVAEIIGFWTVVAVLLSILVWTSWRLSK